MEHITSESGQLVAYYGILRIINMANFFIRPAQEDDFTAIKRLVRNARINPTGLKWYRFVVAENDLDTVIGCAQIKPHRDGSRELASLVVEPGYRSQGIARSLVVYLIEKNEGELFLMCRSSLGEFYRKLGFDIIDEPFMPPYFRRINRLASIAEILRKEGDTLLVMRRG